MSTLKSALFASAAAAVILPAAAEAQSNPSVIVTVENVQSSRGVFLTPPWLAIHDGTFDSYDGGQPASTPLGGNEIEALAEDGNNGPITATFERLQPFAPQIGALTGPGGPLAPGDKAAVTFQVNPADDRYFSYASMIIPSNDFFIANGNPRAHLLFDDAGNFVGEGFTVTGQQTNDAGTEANDEIATNVAFLGQAAPNTGVTEALPVTTPAAGFAAPGALSFPNGVLNHPVFGRGDFTNNAIFRVSFQYVDLGATNRFVSSLSPDQEVGAAVASDATGRAAATSLRGQSLLVRVNTDNLTGPIIAAHLHRGAAGANGPVIVNLGSGVRGDNVIARVSPSDLTAAFSGDFEDFLGDVAAGNVYINIHTAANPGGEIRGQLELVERGRS